MRRRNNQGPFLFADVPMVASFQILMFLLYDSSS